MSCPGLNSATNKFTKLTIFRDGLAKTGKFAKLTIFRDDVAKATKFTKSLLRFCAMAWLPRHTIHVIYVIYLVF